MKLLRGIKGALYFPLAYYFRFFAEIRLRRWKPRVIVVTGSSGKTTLLNLIESQLQNKVRYAYKANSSYGVSFDILELRRKTFLIYEWLFLFLLAPFAVFKPLPKKEIYVVEVDCDRPEEGKFLATLLTPEITLWLNSTKTHSMNFDGTVRKKRFDSIEKAIAHEFGYLLAFTKRLVIINGDSELINGELHRTKARIKKVSRKGHLENYQITSQGHTKFRIDGKEYLFDYLLPEDTLYSIKMVLELLESLKISPDYSFSRFKLPPGRSSVFKGIKNITIVDSSYNTNLDSMRVVLDMFSRMPTSAEASTGKKAFAGKWVVLGDMIEQGETEKEEHEKLAKLILGYRFDRVILMGPRASEYTYPALQQQMANGKWQNVKLESLLTPTEVLDYLKNNIRGGETILFKGARFLEGVVEHLLANKEDVRNLCRQEAVWKKRRKQWGL